MCVFDENDNSQLPTYNRNTSSITTPDYNTPVVT